MSQPSSSIAAGVVHRNEVFLWLAKNGWFALAGKLNGDQSLGSMRHRKNPWLHPKEAEESGNMSLTDAGVQEAVARGGGESCLNDLKVAGIIYINRHFDCSSVGGSSAVVMTRATKARVCVRYTCNLIVLYCSKCVIVARSGVSCTSNDILERGLVKLTDCQ